MYRYFIREFIQKNRSGCQTDVSATTLAAFALAMAAEAVESLAATSFPPEIATTSFFH